MRGEAGKLVTEEESQPQARADNLHHVCGVRGVAPYEAVVRTGPADLWKGQLQQGQEVQPVHAEQPCQQ